MTLIQILLAGKDMSPLKSLYCASLTPRTFVPRRGRAVVLLETPIAATDADGLPSEFSLSLPDFAPICLVFNAALILPVEGFAALRAIPALGFFTILSNCTLTMMLNLSAIYLIGLSAMVLSLSKVV